MKYSFMLLLIAFSAVSWGQSQSNPVIEAIIPPSPTAARIMRVDDQVVNHYTGTATFSIPLYTVKDGDISMPISLNYTTGGIRLAEEAGWAGLGWNLMAGGMITRTIRDKDDFGGSYFTSAVPEVDARPLPSRSVVQLANRSDFLYEFFCDDTLSTTKGDLGFRTAFSNHTAYDFEADLFSFNFAGYTGKFIIKRNREVVLAAQENFQVSFNTAGTSFTVVDDQGFRYEFGEPEYTQTSGSAAASVSSWHLSRITSPKGIGVVLRYIRQSTWSIVPGTVHQTMRHNLPGFSANPASGLVSSTTPAQLYQNIVLSHIEFTNGVVYFDSDNNRPDLSNSRRLTGVRIFQKTTSADSSLFFGYRFFHSFFNSGVPTSNPIQFLRLRLDSIQQYNGIELMPPYIFQYHSDASLNLSLTAKSSFSTDHWGFFNNRSSNTLIPSLYMYHERALGWLDLPGADRSCNPIGVRLFSLTGIRYPTGGRVEIEQEAHDFDEGRSVAGQPLREEHHLQRKAQQHLVSTAGTTSGTVDLSVKYGDVVYATIAFRCSSTSALNSLRTTSGRVVVTLFNNRYDISSPSLSISGSVAATGELQFRVPAHTVQSWQVYIDPTLSSGLLQDVSIGFRWYELERASSGAIAGGGLRIRSITHIDATEQPVKKVIYEYRLQEDRNGDGISEQYSSGLRLSPLFYSRTEVIWGTNNQGGNEAVRYLTRYANSLTPLASSIAGAVVGYSQVNEIPVHPVTNQPTNGQTTYRFYNQPDSIMQYHDHRIAGLTNIGWELNGKPLSTTVFRQQGSALVPVRQQEQYYRIVGRNLIYGLKLDDVQGPTGSLNLTACPPGDNGAARHLIGCIHPVIQSAKVLMDSTILIDYDSQQPALMVRTGKRFTYTTDLYRNLRATTKFNSLGEQERIVVRYAYETPGTVGDGLRLRNRILQIDQEAIWKAGVNVQQTDMIYSFFNGQQLIELAEKRKRLLGQPQFTEATFQQYDSRGNLLQYTSKNGIVHSFIWGYNQSLPVAHIKGATYQQAISLINAANLNNITEGALRSELLKLRNGLPGAEVMVFGHRPLYGLNMLENPARRAQFFQYDPLARLSLIRNEEGRIEKKLEYAYQVPQNSIAAWRRTGVQRCGPCSANLNYISTILQAEERDANPNSSSYGQARWVDIGVSTSCANVASYEPTGIIRCRQVDGVNTGEQEREEVDRNPCSLTFGQVRYVLIGVNLQACPLPTIIY